MTVKYLILNSAVWGKRFDKIMRQRLSIIFALVFLNWMLLGIQPIKKGFGSHSAWADEKKTVFTINASQLKEAIHLSARYLRDQCGDDGQFLYRININPAHPPKVRYNMLRHAGAIYALASYEQVYPQKKTRDAIKRSTDYLKTVAIAPVSGEIPALAVWSPPAITRSGKPLQAKLGGTGLGLVALMSVENIMPGTTPLGYLRRMGEFLIYMQKTDGSFYSKYFPDHRGRDDSWTSLYYPGEAALGLLMLYEKDPSIIWQQAAANSIAYLARKRRGRKTVEADHWSLLATAKLLSLYDRHPLSAPKQLIVDHAIQICESILKGKPNKYGGDLRKHGFTDDGRTTPTATRLEGLLAILDFLPEEKRKLRQNIVECIDDGILFLLRSQVRSGEFAGAVPRATRLLPESHPQYTKAFNRRAGEVRIDYEQHALSALLQYEKSFF